MKTDMSTIPCDLGISLLLQKAFYPDKCADFSCFFVASFFVNSLRNEMATRPTTRCNESAREALILLLTGLRILSRTHKYRAMLIDKRRVDISAFDSSTSVSAWFVLWSQAHLQAKRRGDISWGIPKTFLPLESYISS